jgi:hypothetical protein
MEHNDEPGPFRKTFMRNDRLWLNLSPGLWIVLIFCGVILDLIGLGMLNNLPVWLPFWIFFQIIPIILGGFIQDWANNEPRWSWLNKIFKD